MFTRFTKDLITRNEGSLARVVDSLAAQLAQPQSIFGDQSGIVITRTIESLNKWLDHLEVPASITEESARVLSVMDEHYELIEFALRRDLTRILNLYTFASRIDDILEDKTTSAGQIEAAASSLIERILSQDKTKGIRDEQINIYDFRTSDQVESGNFFQDLSTGIITADVDPLLEVDGAVTITFNRPVTESSPYETLDPSVNEDPQQGDDIFDAERDPLVMTISTLSSNGFNMLLVRTDSSFVIDKIEADLSNNGAFTDVTRAVIGSAINIGGESLATPTSSSLLDVDGTSYYAVWYPEVVFGAKVTIRFVPHDVQPVNISKVLSNHGDVKHEFSVRESLIISRAVDVAGSESELRELNKTAAEGQLVEVTELRPIRKIRLVTAQHYTIGQRVRAEGALKTVSSQVRISEVQIFVDSHDPDGVIEYFIDSTRFQRLPISPVNSNPTEPIRVVFSSPFPVSLRLVIVIPETASYLPTVNSVIIRTKEVKS